MRDSFAVLSHSLGEGFLFVHLPPLRRVTAVEPRSRGQRRVKRSRRRPGVQRPVRAALKDRQLQFLGNLRMAVCEAGAARRSPNLRRSARFCRHDALHRASGIGVAFMLGRSSSACGPLRQILQRKRMSAPGGRAEVAAPAQGHSLIGSIIFSL